MRGLLYETAAEAARRHEEDSASFPDDLFPENMVFVRKLREDELTEMKKPFDVYVAFTASGERCSGERLNAQNLFNEAVGNNYQPMWMQ